MANRIFYQQDCDLQKLNGKTVAIIGYGSQGHAHALNLKDSGVNVIVGLYNGSKSWAKAEAQGLKVMTAAEATKAADIIMILINDEKQAAHQRGQFRFRCGSWFQEHLLLHHRYRGRMQVRDPTRRR